MAVYWEALFLIFKFLIIFKLHLIGQPLLLPITSFQLQQALRWRRR